MQFLFLLAVFRIEHLFMRDAVNGDLIRYYPESVLLIVAETIALGFEIYSFCPVVLKAEIYPLLKDKPSLPLSVGSRDYSSYMCQLRIFFIGKASQAGRTLILLHDEYVKAYRVYAVHIQTDAILLHDKDLGSELHDLVEFPVRQFIEMFYFYIHTLYIVSRFEIDRDK